MTNIETVVDLCTYLLTHVGVTHAARAHALLVEARAHLLASFITVLVTGSLCVYLASLCVYLIRYSKYHRDTDTIANNASLSQR